MDTNSTNDKSSVFGLLSLVEPEPKEDLVDFIQNRSRSNHNWIYFCGCELFELKKLNQL
jgi:hypothetical protein